MRKFVALFLIAIAVSQTLGLFETDASWVAFKQKFDRQYADDNEEIMRYELFKESRKLVEKNNVDFKNGKVTYTLGLTQFSDRTPEEAYDMKGLEIEPEDP